MPTAHDTGLALHCPWVAPDGWFSGGGSLDFSVNVLLANSTLQWGDCQGLGEGRIVCFKPAEVELSRCFRVPLHTP